VISRHQFATRERKTVAKNKKKILIYIIITMEHVDQKSHKSVIMTTANDISTNINPAGKTNSNMKHKIHH
jgi:hypothetical protein